MGVGDSQVNGVPSSARRPVPARRGLAVLGLVLLLLLPVLRLVGVPAAAASWVVAHLGYWSTLLAFGIFVWFLARLIRAGGFAWRKHWRGLLVVLLGGVLLQVQEPHRLRVMYDEYALLTTSLDMHYQRSAATASYAVSDGRGHLDYLGQYVEKRQLLFPFLVSLLHDVAGYHPANVYVLNAFLGVAFLGVVYWAGVLLGGSGIGVLGVLLATGLPLVAQNATGGGYDLLNATLLLLLFVEVVRHLRVPTLRDAELLVITFILVAQVRDESWVLGFLALGALGWGWWRVRRVEVSWFLALAPLLLLVPVLINLIYLHNPAFFESSARGEAAFGTGYFHRNLTDALAYLYNGSGDLTNSPLLSWLGTAALLLCAVNGLRRLGPLVREGDPLLAVLGFGGFAAAFTGLVLFYFWGQLTDPVAARLSFPLQAGFLVAILYLAGRLLRSRRSLVVAQGIAALFLLGYTVPADARHAATNSLASSREAAWSVAYAGSHGGDNTLFIARSALPFICHRQAAIPLSFLSTAPAYFDSLCHDDAYRRILVLQVYRRDSAAHGWVPLHDEMATYAAHHDLVLKPVAAHVFERGYLSRISRLVRPDGRRPAGK